jgi:SAM-dependent methyltransferase
VSGVAGFDALAATYDDTFTDSTIGRVMRNAVWRRLAVAFEPGSRVLEIGCGTGVDAAWLADRGVAVVATDVSAAMVEVARGRGVDAHQVAAEGINGFIGDEVGGFDGALSNFGGLNCIGDLDAVACGIAKALRPGGTAVLCVMGPVVPWEWFWFLAHGRRREAFRRLRRGTEWRGMSITYPSIGAVRSVFATSFDVERVWALGALVPPSYVEPLAARHPGALRRLDRIERRIEAWPGVARVADHYVVELRRR